MPHRTERQRERSRRRIKERQRKTQERRDRKGHILQRKSKPDKPETVTKVEPRNIFNVITGEVMRERVRRATE